VVRKVPLRRDEFVAGVAPAQQRVMPAVLRWPAFLLSLADGQVPWSGPLTPPFGHPSPTGRGDRG
jgi:hypothetical protein